MNYSQRFQGNQRLGDKPQQADQPYKGDNHGGSKTQ